MDKPKSVLILNTGSSSLKWVVLDSASEALQAEGSANWVGGTGARRAAEIDAALAQVNGISAVGHRVVHGGLVFRDGVLIDETVRREIGGLADLAPLHNPAALAGIEAVGKRFPDLPQIAAFDTGFHRTISETATVYPIPWEWTSRWQLRRFGFHGLSVSYAVERARELVGHVPAKLIVCHLGAGCSVTAVRDGRSIATSMGFTPLEGVMMAQRSGSVDPGLLLYLLQRRGISPADLDRALNEHSGLLGVSGISSNMRDVLDAAAEGNPRAQLARDMFVQNVVTTVGGMAAALNGLDGLVFTGGIGERGSELRAAVCAAFEYLNVAIDEDANVCSPVDVDIARSSSAVHVLVVHAREDLTVLRQVKRVLRW